MSRALQLALAAGIVAGCGSPCPQLSGDWLVVAHCESSFVNKRVAIVQRDCSLVLTGAFEGSGVADQDGNTQLAGAAAGHSVSCEGTATSSRIIVNCNSGCGVTMSK